MKPGVPAVEGPMLAQTRITRKALMAIDWKTFDELVYASARAALVRRWERQKATVYAIAFHEFYAELDGPIALPWLAANSVESVTRSEESRWSAPDWKWPRIPYAPVELKSLHRSVQKEAVSGDESHWHKVHARFIESFIRACRKLTRELAGHPSADRNLVAVCLVEEDDDTVLRRCLTAAQFRRHFPDTSDQRSPVALQSDSKWETYAADLYGHQAEVLKLGSAAVPFLTEILKQDTPESWVAAQLLGRLGARDPKSLSELKRRAKRAGRVAFHDTIALALLGETDELLQLAGDARTREIAIQGLCSLYSSVRNECVVPGKLDYAPLEKLLAIPACRKKVNSLYSGPCEIRETDVDEALRGANSPFEAIREHAITVLGNRKLGARNASRILPVLAAHLDDPRVMMRRLALLSLGRWKKSARDFLADIRKRLQDPDPANAQIARNLTQSLK